MFSSFLPLSIMGETGRVLMISAYFIKKLPMQSPLRNLAWKCPDFPNHAYHSLRRLSSDGGLFSNIYAAKS